MKISRRGGYVALFAVMAVLLLWSVAGADHKVTFSQTNTQTGGTAIYGTATSGVLAGHVPVAIWGEATAATGVTVGVEGEVASNDGVGLLGLGPLAGVRGQSALNGGVGVRGISLAPGIGVRGEAAAGGEGVFGISSTGVRGVGTTYGVHGQTTSKSGTAAGVVGSAASNDAVGVWGLNSASDGIGVRGTGQSVGVEGIATAAGAGVRGEGPYGVIGESPATTGNTTGVLGDVASSAGTGVFGSASSTTGKTVGVRGFANSTSGIGVYGLAQATSGATTGVRGEVGSSSGVAIQGFCRGSPTRAPSCRAGLFQNGNVEIQNGHLYVHGNHVADVAEDMPLIGSAAPGDVVVLAATRRGYGVVRAGRSYDTLVAGIVSGAPRIHLQVGPRRGMAPVAVAGVVRAKATAKNGAIRLGDLLTTSSVPGHLMRCPVPVRCVGAIVGKALEPLRKGEKQILVLLWRL